MPGMSEYNAPSLMGGISISRLPPRLETLTLNLTAGAPHLKSGDVASASSDAGQSAPVWQADICAIELHGVGAVEHPALRLLGTASGAELPLH